MKIFANKTLKEERKEERGKLVAAGFLFAACYLFILLCTFILLVVRGGAGWKEYIAANYEREISLVLSLFVLTAIIYLYFYFEDRKFLCAPGNILLFFTILTFTGIVCTVWSELVTPYYYTRPYALFALLCLFLMGRRHALFLNAVFVLFMFSLDIFAGDMVSVTDIRIYSTLLIGFADGTLAVFLSSKVRTRLRLLLVGVFLSVPTMLAVFIFQIPIAENDVIDYFSAAGFQVLGCLTSTVLALAFMPVFEGIFNRLTPFRLRELTSTNAPILVRLREEAPGTFNHSLIVAQLAETCAVAIGENAELARAAAYYHDVGKLKQPDCFTENQTDYNIHDEITPELSADIIRSHAKDGYELILKAHLPKVIADVALEHHGTLPIKYFYDKAVRYAGDADIKDFSYLGPTPRTRIAAIVMVADAVEAATRASADRSPDNVEKVCRSIIEERMDLDQFDNCDISMRELNVIKQTLVEALSGVHHHRVEYPSIRFNRDRKAVKEDKDE